MKFQKTYNVLGMSCISCHQKISEALNAIPNLSAIVDLKTNTAQISSHQEIDIQLLNNKLSNIGHYFLEDP